MESYNEDYSDHVPAKKRIFTYKEFTSLDEQQEFEALWEHYFTKAKAGDRQNSIYTLESRYSKLLEEDAYPFLHLFLVWSQTSNELQRYIRTLIYDIQEVKNNPSRPEKDWEQDSQEELDKIKAFLENNDVMALAAYFADDFNDKKSDLLELIAKQIDSENSIKISTTGARQFRAEARVRFFTMLESMVMAHQAAEAIIQEMKNHNTAQIPAQWLNNLTFGLFNWLYQVVDKLRDRINPSRVTLRLLKQELLDTAVAQINDAMKKNPVTSQTELSSMFSALATITDRFALANAYLQVKAKTVATQYAAVKGVKAAAALPSDPFDAIRDQAKDVLYHGETDAFHDLKEKDKNIGSIVKEENAWGNTVREKHLARPLNKK